MSEQRREVRVCMICHATEEMWMAKLGAGDAVTPPVCDCCADKHGVKFCKCQETGCFRFEKKAEEKSVTPPKLPSKPPEFVTAPVTLPAVVKKDEKAKKP